MFFKLYSTLSFCRLPNIQNNKFDHKCRHLTVQHSNWNEQLTRTAVYHKNNPIKHSAQKWSHGSWVNTGFTAGWGTDMSLLEVLLPFNPFSADCLWMTKLHSHCCKAVPYLWRTNCHSHCCMTMFYTWRTRFHGHCCMTIMPVTSCRCLSNNCTMWSSCWGVGRERVKIDGHKNSTGWFDTTLTTLFSSNENKASPPTQPITSPRSGPWPTQ